MCFDVVTHAHGARTGRCWLFVAPTGSAGVWLWRTNTGVRNKSRTIQYLLHACPSTAYTQ